MNYRYILGIITPDNKLDSMVFSSKRKAVIWIDANRPSYACLGDTKKRKTILEYEKEFYCEY